MPTIKNLVISGGGIHGISFLGAIKYLDENNILNDIEQYVGTSAGSMISLLLLIGYKYQELYDFCLSFDMEKIVDNPNLDNFLNNHGFESSNKLIYVIKRLLENKNISDTITFKELYELKNYGPYANEDGELNICFISNNDIFKSLTNFD